MICQHTSQFSVFYTTGVLNAGLKTSSPAQNHKRPSSASELTILSRHRGTLGSAPSSRVLHHTLSALRSLMGKERRKGKGTLGTLSFPFLLGHRFQLKWLVIWGRHPSERGYGRFFGHLCSGNSVTVFCSKTRL